ncbi:MAG TPA: ATPase, T2SS/T4P/T4SS family [Rhodocyclaceae bacterium]|jgi:general secretion pathway protein E/type IV pilus assembly protein PilB|nr:ATPase, T2SS/T4P/T4SS family [Rhodocyclaceae bacterium]
MGESLQPPHQLIGQTLKAQGLISEDQLRIALHEQMQAVRPISLGKLLVKLGFISEATLRDTLGFLLGQPTIDLANVLIDTDTLQCVPCDLAKKHHLMPLAWCAKNNHLRLAMAAPDDIVALDRLRSHIPEIATIETVLAGESEIAHAIDRHYGRELSIDGILHELETGQAGTALQEYTQPIVRLIDALLADAVKQDASDIHFEPEAGFLRIRYRIDGILRQIRVLHQSYWPAMVVRLKIIGGMNIAETRAPQDGRTSLSISGRHIDFRMATLPTLHGENIALRILDRHKGIVPLHALGLSTTQLDQIHQMISRPEGIILVTGPTGSGKTTTLYSVLNHLNSEHVNIMTLEDPVEYPLATVRQTSVGEASKLDFAEGIRSLLRQDPDIILVGEIRDADTAAMAFRAAMTGHQVYATLHANSVFGAVPRLIDIGVSPELLAGNIIGIVGQRLVRKLCTHCRQPHCVNAHEATVLGVSPDILIHRPVGCPHCNHQGYRGRGPLMEALLMDDELDDLISQHVTQGQLRQTATRKGYIGLVEMAISRVLDGTTSFEEAARVIDFRKPHP